MTEKELWKEYCEKAGLDFDTPYEAWGFGGDADKLAELVIKGIKTATASAADLYAVDCEKMPEPGDYSVILDGNDNAVCVIQTTKINIVKFKNVSADHAYKEGEGDRSLQYWRKVHKEFFKDEYDGYDIEFNEDSNVACEEFKVVYIPKQIE